ncbi:hypothetical protein VHUM_01872 [Vanrija humicola]|uniref:NAD-dependent epimerase/dehydratase domain-containing protein n=1 Tax=Vanrija humicola TaxID=5417 RepID=A0A7D8Z4D8_VANHU|nr:hypothetical protein VHUM_01872 [Vanrija humicola]
MPALTSGLILATGASGFIGTHTVAALLTAGFNVRITARSQAKAEHVRELFPGKQDRISYTVVPEISEPNAWDEAVVGVDGVIHLASPVTLSHAGPPSEVIDPAVNGVLHLLESLKKFNPNVKRVVQISSSAAVGITERPDVYVYTEKDWNDAIVDITNKLGADAPGGAKYAASKTLSERAFWKYIADNKPTWDGVSINPVFNFGPATQFATADSGAITSSLSILTPYLNPGLDAKFLEQPYGSMVDVRDVAFASVKALTTPEAADERYLLSADTLWGNDLVLGVAEVIKEPGYLQGNADPEYRAKLDASKSRHDGSKVEKAFGFTYRKKADSIRDSVETLVAAKKAQKA